MNTIAGNGGTALPASKSGEAGIRIERTLLWRTLSALILGPIALAAIWSGGLFFVALIAVIALALAWEWDRLTGVGSSGPALMLHGAAALSSLVLVYLEYPVPALAVTALAAALAGLLAVWRGRAWTWPALGIVYLIVPCLAFVWLFQRDGGRDIAVWLLAVVWATDIFAYATGRLVGGPKLAPIISPKKTWSGLMGGVAAAAIASLALATAFSEADPWLAALAGALVAVISQLGDLTESVIKRHFGVKDASGLIPGHGGVLDRIDGLLLAAPVTAVAVMST